MSSKCFKPENSSSGRRLYMQLWYGTYMFNMHQDKQYFMWKTVFDTLVLIYFLQVILPSYV
jgi:hypothetical protein